MDLWLYLSYIIAILALIITPGPNIMLMITHSLNHGQRAVFLNASGGVSAAVLLMSLSLLGIKALLPEQYLSIFAIIGAGYLAYLGISNIRTKNIDFSLQTGISKVKGKRFYIEAFLTGISNPKDILFFVLFLPQFIDPNLPFITSSLLMIIGWVICDYSIMLSYGSLALTIKKRFQESHILKMIHGTGYLILLLAIILFGSTLKSLFF